ncbi:hypothetical protein F2Q70_00035692 [Brassica cretica]|uniref:Uncharacterized protein n=1 Tax=Brassica cretica TaxID=69181 RepID=A0A8S9JUT8_BRACR|nr:hypothetical protein F2Q70_00035692 [Brassica cretica]
MNEKSRTSVACYQSQLLPPASSPSPILLTPLFCHLELDPSLYQCNETTKFIDIPYLINCHILRDETTYSFLGQNGSNLYCKLPQPNITSLIGGDNAYDLGPLDDDADDAAYHRWMVDSQRKNNSLKKRILKAITGGCMGAPSTAEPRQDQPTPSNRHPGKEPAGTARGNEETPWATPRKRNRRSAGQSESDDTD